MDSDRNAILHRAQEKLLVAEQEVAKWVEFIRQYMELAREEIGNKRESGPTFASSPSVTTSAVAHANSQRRPAPEVEQTIQAAVDFISKLGRPVTLTELHEEMMRLGVPVGGKDPKATLDSRLRYSGEFQTSRGRGWWIASTPSPGEISSGNSFVSYSLGDVETEEPPLEVSNSGSA